MLEPDRQERAGHEWQSRSKARAPLTARSHAQVSRFFDGLDLVEPGVVQLHRWRAGVGDLAGDRELANYGGVGRKP